MATVGRDSRNSSPSLCKISIVEERVLRPLPCALSPRERMPKRPGSRIKLEIIASLPPRVKSFAAQNIPDRHKRQTRLEYLRPRRRWSSVREQALEPILKTEDLWKVYR